METANAMPPATCGGLPTVRPHAEGGGLGTEAYTLARALIGSRQNVSPKGLLAPAPTTAELDALLALAAAAPDQGVLNPWRFIIVPPEQRHRLAEVFALALIDRDPSATLEQIESAREPDVSPLERMVSMGAAIQNLLLGAHALGYGAELTSG